MNMTILTTSVSLMIQAITLWKRRLEVVIPLSIACCAHWVILWRGMFVVHGTYEPTLKTCVVIKTDHLFLNVEFFTTMAFDFILLCFALSALWPKQQKKWSIENTLFRDGLAYFFVVFVCNTLPAIFNVLDLDQGMNTIATVPVVTISAVLVCRLVIQLDDSKEADLYIHTTKVLTKGPHSPLRVRNGNPRRFPMPRRPEVHVTTDQFVMEDESPDMDPQSPITPRSEKAGGTIRLAAVDMTINYDSEEFAKEVKAFDVANAV